MSTPPRTFSVTKDDGSHWAMQYGAHGVTWIPLPTPTDATAPVRPPAFGINPYVHAITAVADSAAGIFDAWQRHSQLEWERTNAEVARHGEWLADMIGRWGQAHSSTLGIDLRVSEYVGREADAMMRLLVENKKAALPQSMLYELDQIQEALRGYRRTLGDQFDALAADSEIALAEVVHEALPHRSLNLDFLHLLAEDPAIRWTQAVQAKSTGDFGRELSVIVRDPGQLHQRLFVSNEVELSPAEAPRPGILQKFVRLVTPALPRLFEGDYKSDAWERRDQYRELSLFAAEVTQSRALTAAWLATADVVSAAHGRPLEVRTDHHGVQLSLGSSVARPAIEA